MPIKKSVLKGLQGGSAVKDTWCPAQRPVLDPRTHVVERENELLQGGLKRPCLNHDMRAHLHTHVHKHAHTHTLK